MPLMGELWDIVRRRWTARRYKGENRENGESVLPPAQSHTESVLLVAAVALEQAIFGNLFPVVPNSATGNRNLVD